MEFQGRIAKVLPVRSGVSQRTGNEWKSRDQQSEGRHGGALRFRTQDSRVHQG